jgi:hypothetical protein
VGLPQRRQHAHLVKDFAGTPSEVVVSNTIYTPFGFLTDGTLLTAGEGVGAYALAPVTYEYRVASIYFESWIAVPDGLATWGYPPFDAPDPMRLALWRGNPLSLCDQWNNNCVSQLTEFASISLEEFGLQDNWLYLGKRTGAMDQPPDLAVYVDVIDIAAFGDGFVYLLEIDTPSLQREAALVIWDGQTARLLPDRLAYRPAALIVDGEDLLVVARNGAVFRGVAR